MESNSLLQLYRSDRRKLLEFLLSSGTELRTSSGPVTSLSGIDIDALSAEYVVECVKSGDAVDVSNATKKYNAESEHPLVIHSRSGDSYFLVSNPDSTGSPPRRMPPPVKVAQTSNHASDLSNQHDSVNVSKSVESFAFELKAPDIKPMEPIANEITLLGLPNLRTGLSDDDLRETAYEVVLVSSLLSGSEACSVDYIKKEKSSKLLSSFKRRDKARLQPQFSDRISGLFNTIRVQMQISEKMDACIRRNLVQLAAMRTREQIDLSQLALGLLTGLFKSDFPSEKLYMHWKNRQANILEELLYHSSCLDKNERATIRRWLAKIRDSKEWDVVMSPSVRVEVLSSIRLVASKLSSLAGHFNIRGETYYWTAAYHLNIRVYEKLLFGVFDVLEESQLIEEADAMLIQLKSVWSVLGITEQIHNSMYGWVLFQQYVTTGESLLLDNAIQEFQKVVSDKENDVNEELYIKRLVCSKEIGRSKISSSLVQAIFHSIGTWCDNQLRDYHLHFGRKPHEFKLVMSLASTVGIPLSADQAEMKLIKLDIVNGDAGGKMRARIHSSIEAACWRAAHSAITNAQGERTHPLALLANELRSIVKREISLFVPVLSKWLPDCPMISAMLVHRFYGERLKPFLSGVSSLSEDVRLVLPAANMLDDELTQLFKSVTKSKLQRSVSHKLEHYQIGEVSRPIILDWLIAQHDHIMEWTERAFDLEDWEPLSFHQKHAASIVEVFRIIEETVAQLFGLNLPKHITHLQALLSLIYHSLDAYLLRVLNQLVEKRHLYPSAPPLTRFAESSVSMMKKKLLNYIVPDEKVIMKLDALTISKLCIRLNTLKYIQKQISVTEDGIRNSLALVKSSFLKNSENESYQASEESLFTNGEAVDELFATTFDCIREAATNCINKTCDLIGARVVFWDLRDMFLEQLYRGTVEGARLESLLPHIDSALDNICDLITGDLRDMVVLSICRAALEAYVFVLIDGGPSRAFSDSDVSMMEEDLSILKEFFIVDGEGLPRSKVEQEAKLAEQILDLYSLETETLVQMLMTASELTSMGISSRQQGRTGMEDAHTLVRVLCHKKDREASKFLKKQYELPMSSEYDDTPSRDSASKPYGISEIIRSTSFHWNKNSIKLTNQ